MMMPTTQTTDRNCTEACLASLVVCKISDLPDLARVDECGDSRELVLDAWLTHFFKQTMVSFDWNGDWLPEKVVHMLSGVSPRGARHMVVARGGEMIHDPHPEGGGVVAPYRVHMLVDVERRKFNPSMLKYLHRDVICDKSIADPLYATGLHLPSDIADFVAGFNLAHEEGKEVVMGAYGPEVLWKGSVDEFMAWQEKVAAKDEIAFVLSPVFIP